VFGSKATATFTSQNGKQESLTMKGDFFDTQADILDEAQGGTYLTLPFLTHSLPYQTHHTPTQSPPSPHTNPSPQVSSSPASTASCSAAKTYSSGSKPTACKSPPESTWRSSPHCASASTRRTTRGHRITRRGNKCRTCLLWQTKRPRGGVVRG